MDVLVSSGDNFMTLYLYSYYLTFVFSDEKTRSPRKNVTIRPVIILKKRWKNINKILNQ